MIKKYLFKEPSVFEVDEHGIGIIISSPNKAILDFNTKIAQIEFGGEIVKLKDFDFTLVMERPDINIITAHRPLTREELTIKVPDLEIWGTIVNNES